MAETFNNGDSNLSIRTKLNANAEEINEIVEETIPTLVPNTRTIAGKPLTADIALVKGDVGLSNVDNTSDASKPVSTATQTALNLKADTSALPTKTSLGLQNVDNTSDANKPVSTAQAAAINARVPSTRTVAGKPLSADITLDKTDVGLSNVDNTSDVNKPISALTANALSSKATPADIDAALDAATIFFDEETFEGAVYPVPTEGQPAVGSEDNPIKAITSSSTPVADVVENGNLNAVTSNAVYDAIETNNLLITGGSDYTIADLYELITNGGLAPEDAPTDFVVDDTANTAGFTFADVGDVIGDYEYKIVDGAITTATVNPIVVGNINAAIGTVKIRKKGEVGVSSPSAWLVNPTAYTAASGDGDYMAGYVPFDLLSGLSSGDEFTSVTDGVYSQGPEGDLAVTLPYHMPNAARIAFKVLTADEFNNNSFGIVDNYTLTNIRGVSNIEEELYRKYFSEDIISGATVAAGDHLILEFIDPNLGEGEDNAVRELKLYKTSDGGETIVPIAIDPILNYVNGYTGYVAFGLYRGCTLAYPQQLGCILDGGV